MKKYSYIHIIAIILLSLSSNSYAQASKIITLIDGSVLKGKVIQLQDNIYTIETTTLGQVDIPESNILSIASPEAANTQDQQSNENQNTQKAQLQKQAQQMQGNILSNPELMTDIQNIINDEEIQATLSDPKLLNDILSYDQEKIQQNENVQNLMQNPKMLNLMNKIHQKTPDQQ